VVHNIATLAGIGELLMNFREHDENIKNICFLVQICNSKFWTVKLKLQNLKRVSMKKIESKTKSDPKKLNICLERTELIKNLRKKYGNTIKGIVKYKNKISDELNSLNNSKGNLEKSALEKKFNLVEIKNVLFEIKFGRKELVQMLATQ
jgi:DNA repair protein RecN (Recombination protein N)